MGSRRGTRSHIVIRMGCARWKCSSHLPASSASTRQSSRRSRTAPRPLGMGNRNTVLRAEEARREPAAALAEAPASHRGRTPRRRTVRVRVLARVRGLTTKVSTDSCRPNRRRTCPGSLSIYQPNAPRTVLVDDDQPCDKYTSVFRSAITTINNANVTYNPFTTNSNAAARYMLRSAGLGRVPLPRGMIMPGWNRDLFGWGGSW